MINRLFLSRDANPGALPSDEKRYLSLRITCPWFRTSIIHSIILIGMTGHTASWKTSSLWWRAVTSFSDNDGCRWSFSLRYQGEKTPVWSSCSPINHCYRRPAALEKSPEGIMRNTWGGCLKISQYFPWICVSRSSEKQPLIWGWFSARDDSLVIFQQLETLLRQKHQEHL